MDCQRMDQDKATTYMLSRPESVFVVFTHQDGRKISVDYLIRKAMGLRYRIRPDDTFSHCGVVWAENGQLMYYHQTWPKFKKEKFSYRPMNHFFEVADPIKVEWARTICEHKNGVARGYGIGTILNFVFTFWNYSLRNFIRIGEVCSSALALAFPEIVMPLGDKLRLRHSDVTPHHAFIRFEDYVWRTDGDGSKQFIVDKTA